MSEANLKLYAYTFTSRAERVIWALRELGLDYELVRLDPFQGDIFKPDFLALNPDAKVPVLVHNGEVFTESLAIMEYLDRLVQDVSLVPMDAAESYRYRHLMYYIATEVETYLWIADQSTRLKAFYPWPEGTLETALARVGRNIKTVYGKLTCSAYAAGEHFSIADIYAWQVVNWARMYGIKVPAPVVEYLDRIAEREAFPAEMKGLPDGPSS